MLRLMDKEKKVLIQGMSCKTEDEREVNLNERPHFMFRRDSPRRKKPALLCCVRGLQCRFDEKGAKGVKSGAKGDLNWNLN